MESSHGGEDIRAPWTKSGEPAIPLIEQLLSLGKSSGYSPAESWGSNLERDQLRARALKHWNETALHTKPNRPIDAILCPAAATLAAPQDGRVFPSRKPFNAAEWKSSPRPTSFQPRNPIEELVARQWEPDAYDGAPIGLQLVGRRWQEEKLLRDLRVVDAVVNQT